MVHFATDQITGIKCILLAQPTSQNSGLLHCLVCFVSNSHVHMDFVYLGLKLKNNNNITVHTLCAQSTHTIIAQADEINFVAIKKSTMIHALQRKKNYLVSVILYQQSFFICNYCTPKLIVILHFLTFPACF